MCKLFIVMVYYNFDEDPNDGLKIEKEVIQLLQKYYLLPESDSEQNSSKEFDIKIVSKDITFEVKNYLRKKIIIER